MTQGSNLDQGHCRTLYILLTRHNLAFQFHGAISLQIPVCQSSHGALRRLFHPDAILVRENHCLRRARQEHFPLTSTDGQLQRPVKQGVLGWLHQRTPAPATDPLRMLNPRPYTFQRRRKPLHLVFGSPVRSGFLTPRVINRNRNRSFYFRIPKKTGPNRCGPVHIGFLRSQDRLRPVTVLTSLKPVQTGLVGVK